MNLFVLTTMPSAAQASQKPRNGHDVTTAVGRRVIMRVRPRRDSRKRQRKRRPLFVHVAIAIAIALVIAFVMGLILFPFAV